MANLASTTATTCACAAPQPVGGHCGVCGRVLGGAPDLAAIRARCDASDVPALCDALARLRRLLAGLAPYLAPGGTGPIAEAAAASRALCDADPELLAHARGLPSVDDEPLSPDEQAAIDRRLTRGADRKTVTLEEMRARLEKKR